MKRYFYLSDDDGELTEFYGTKEEAEAEALETGKMIEQCQHEGDFKNHVCLDCGEEV